MQMKQPHYKNIFVRVYRTYGESYGSKIDCNEPNGTKHTIHRGKMTKDQLLSLKTYQLIRVKNDGKDLFYFDKMVEVQGDIQRLLITELAQEPPKSE